MVLTAVLGTFAKQGLLAAHIAGEGGLAHLARLCTRHLLLHDPSPEGPLPVAVSCLGDLCIHLCTSSRAASYFLGSRVCGGSTSAQAAALDTAVQALCRVVAGDVAAPATLPALVALTHLPPHVLAASKQPDVLLLDALVGCLVVAPPSVPLWLGYHRDGSGGASTSPGGQAGVGAQASGEGPLVHPSPWDNVCATRVSAAGSLLLRLPPEVATWSGPAVGRAIEACLGGLTWWVACGRVAQDRLDVPAHLARLLQKVCGEWGGGGG
jgi:hypothetical protein